MPDLKDRAEREDELAAALLLLFREYEDQGQQIDWIKLQQDLEAILGPALADTYRISFSQLQTQLQLDLGDTDPAVTGAKWAETYSQKLAQMIVENTQKALQAQLDAGEDVDLSGQFDAERAEKIAITETTRSITAGEYAVIGAALALGLFSGFDAVWQTAEDDMVCDECAPLNGEPQAIWEREAPGGPPLHVNCRCYLDYAVGVTEAWTDEAREKSAETRAAHAKGEAPQSRAEDRALE